MAVRFDASGDFLKRTASLPSSTNFTITFWIKRSVDRNDWTYPIGVENADTSSSAYILFGHSNSGDAWQIDQGGSAASFGGSITDGAWYFGAMACSGTGSSALVGYLGTTGALSSVSTTGVSFTVARLNCGSDSYAEFLNGSIAAYKVWDAVLTQAEIENERWFYMPQRTANLHLWWPLLSHSDVGDYSGNGRSATTGGTLATEDGPPIAWRRGPSRAWVPVAGGGGSNVNVATAAGSLTLGGAVPTILNPRAVSVGLGSMVLSGFASQLLSRISTAAGAAVLSGQAPTAVSPYVVPVAVGSLAASGQAPTAVTPYSLTTGVGQLAATGNASSLASTVRISAGSLTLSGQAPAASAPHAIATSAGSLTLGGFSPALDVSADRTVATGAGSLTATGQSPPLLMVIPVAAASATLSGHAPAGTVSFVIPTAPGGLSLTGISPALLHSIAVGLGQMLLSGQAPTAVNPVTLSIGAGAVTLTASVPTMDISADLSVAVESASLTLAGAAPAIGAPQVIAILPAAMLLSGQIPGVDLSNILAVVIQMRPADNVTTSARNELQSNLVRMRHNLEVQ